MNGIDIDTCDAVSQKLCGLIGMFNLLFDMTVCDTNSNQTMSDFTYYISGELQGLYKLVTGSDYHS